jgi:hypothetical protein
MQPDHLTSSQQGTGNKRQDKSGKTVSTDEIPADNRAASGIHEGATQDSDVGGTAPAVRHPNRPEREKMGGNFNGPGKRGDKR